GRQPGHYGFQASARPWRKTTSAFKSVDDAAYVAGQSLCSTLGAPCRIGRQLRNGRIPVYIILRMMRHQTCEIPAPRTCTIATKSTPSASRRPRPAQTWGSMERAILWHDSEEQPSVERPRRVPLRLSSRHAGTSAARCSLPSEGGKELHAT